MPVVNYERILQSLSNQLIHHNISELKARDRVILNRSVQNERKNLEMDSNENQIIQTNVLENALTVSARKYKGVTLL